jgi:hypothetical protein
MSGGCSVSGRTACTPSGLGESTAISDINATSRRTNVSQGVVHLVQVAAYLVLILDLNERKRIERNTQTVAGAAHD